MSNINIDLSSITTPKYFKVTDTIEMFNPTSLFGSMSPTLETKAQQSESFLTSIPANRLYFKEYSSSIFPEINNHVVKRRKETEKKTDKDISFTATSNNTSMIKSKTKTNRYFRGLDVKVSNPTSDNISNVLPTVNLPSPKSTSIASLFSLYPFWH